MTKRIEKFLWLSKEKKVISCDETNKVLNENYSEIKNILQILLMMRVLISCDEKDFKKKIKDLIENLNFFHCKK